MNEIMRWSELTNLTGRPYPNTLETGIARGRTVSVLLWDMIGYGVGVGFPVMGAGWIQNRLSCSVAVAPTWDRREDCSASDQIQMHWA